MNIRILLWILLPLGLLGCASNPPIGSSEQIEASPSIVTVLQDIDAHSGEAVQWGGTIASIENKQGETWLEIVSRDLKASGKPKRSDKTGGRFIVKADEFLEPEIYQKGRAVTVLGSLSGSQAGLIGEQPYLFPVVTSEEIKLWPEYQDNPRQINYGWSYYGRHWGLHSRHFYPYSYWGPRYRYRH